MIQTITNDESLARHALWIAPSRNMSHYGMPGMPAEQQMPARVTMSAFYVRGLHASLLEGSCALALLSASPLRCKSAFLQGRQTPEAVRSFKCVPGFQLLGSCAGPPIAFCNQACKSTHCTCKMFGSAARRSWPLALARNARPLLKLKLQALKDISCNVSPSLTQCIGPSGNWF